jgi:hypothetical protein
MQKSSTSINAVLCIALLAATCIGFLLLPPESELAIHWDVGGTADVVWRKEAALLLTLGIALVLNLVFWVANRIPPADRQGVRLPKSAMMLPALTGLLLAIQIVIVVNGLV